jgi:hypothetical protein
MSDLLGLITGLGILAVLGIYLVLQQKRKGMAFYTNPRELNLNRRLGVHGMNLVDIGYQYQSYGSCKVCQETGIFVLKVPPEDFVAQHYHLQEEINWVCSQCWIKAKVHDPHKEEKPLNMGGKGGFGILDSFDWDQYKEEER